jgi:hypothetical protein
MRRFEAIAIAADSLAFGALSTAFLTESARRDWAARFFILSGLFGLLGLLCGVLSRRSQAGRFAILLGSVLLGGLVVRLLEKSGGRGK